MTEQKPLECITKEEFNLYRKAVEKKMTIYRCMKTEALGVIATTFSLLGVMSTYSAIQTPLLSLQTTPQKGDYFLFGGLLFCMGAALYASRGVGKIERRIKTLKTELNKIIEDPIYQKIKNIEYS